MTKIRQFVVSALALTVLAPTASSLSITASLSYAISTVVEASKLHPTPAPLRTADYAVSTFDKGIVDAFAKAWARSGNGTTAIEGLVLVLRMTDGSFSGRDMGTTNEQKKFTFPWHPATIAIVHTHPNTSDPKPHDDDVTVADKYHVPVFTITNRGMYVYDPTTRKTTKLLSNLDWLDASKFSKSMVAKQ